MAKEVIDEELDEVEEEETEEKSEPKTKSKKETLTLDFEMEPEERLKAEINFTDDPNQKAIGEFLLQEFGKDSTIKDDYKAKKVTLDKILGFVTNEAKKRAEKQKNRSCVMMSDQEVYGLVIHYVHDGAVPTKEETGYTLTKEEKKSLQEQAKEQFLREQKLKLEKEEEKRIEKEKKAKERAIEKEKKEREESGQMSLFDFGA